MSNTALILLTSHGVLGQTGKPTGFHWVEMATPYFALRDAGFEITFASPVGGRPPSDPGSADPETREADVNRFIADAAAMDALERTIPLRDLNGANFDVIYIPGGHGTMWDLAQTGEVAARIAEGWEAGAVVGSVCHGPAALTECYLSDGTPLVAGRKVCAFTDAEERAVELDNVVPFLLETRLRALGAQFECNGEVFGPHVAKDGRLITGQNPASVPTLARALADAARMSRAA
ncbi:MAG: type 1 glutamine amidotransferase domain-containing protein [Pseudomonadota bacterium]